MSGVELADEISALTRRDTRELSSPLCSLPHEDTARRQPSANQGGFRVNQTCRHLSLGLLASRTVRK